MYVLNGKSNHSCKADHELIKRNKAQEWEANDERKFLGNGK